MNLSTKGEPAKPGSPWPQPFSHISTPIRLSLDPSTFKFETSLITEKCDPLEFAVQKYNKEFLFYTPAGLSTVPDPAYDVLSSVTVTINPSEGGNSECANYPKLDENRTSESPEYCKVTLKTQYSLAFALKKLMGVLIHK